MAKLPIALASNIVQNNPINTGGTAFFASGGYMINGDGTVATSSTKQGGAFQSSQGWLLNPDRSIVVKNTAPSGSAFINQTGVLCEPDGSACVSTVQSSTIVNSGGLLVNPNGQLIVSNGAT